MIQDGFGSRYTSIAIPGTRTATAVGWCRFWPGTVFPEISPWMPSATRIAASTSSGVAPYARNPPTPPFGSRRRYPEAWRMRARTANAIATAHPARPDGPGRNRLYSRRAAALPEPLRVSAVPVTIRCARSRAARSFLGLEAGLREDAAHPFGASSGGSDASSSPSIAPAGSSRPRQSSAPKAEGDPVLSRAPLFPRMWKNPPSWTKQR